MKLQKLLIIIGMVLLTCGPAYALTSHNPIHIKGDGTSPFSLYDWNYLNGVTDGDGSRGDPFIIEGWAIDARLNDFGIWIENSTHYFIIRDCEISGATDLYKTSHGSGIMIESSHHATIDNVYSHDNHRGLFLKNVNDSEVKDSNFSNSKTQNIDLLYSNSNNFNDIGLYDGYYGVFLYGSDYNDFEDIISNGSNYSYFFSISDYNDVVSSSSYDAGRHGLYLSNSDWNYFNLWVEDSDEEGIYSWSSNRNEFRNCHVINNGRGGSYCLMPEYPYGYWNECSGMLLLASDYNTIWESEFINNSGYGVYLSSHNTTGRQSENNVVFHNNFIDNMDNPSDSQARDSNDDPNYWSGYYPGYCEMGNYWTDMSHDWTWYWCGGYLRQFCTYDYDTIDGYADAEDTWPVPAAYNNP